MWGFLDLFKKYSDDDQKLIIAIKTISGHPPTNLELYRIATKHSSIGQREKEYHTSNERLEYLGDAVLGTIVAEYLFKKYPFKKEGFLTELRSRIVNREALNNIAMRIGIAEILHYDHKNINLRKVILGNALEAMIGAIFLDKGYPKTRKFVIEKLIVPYFNLKEISRHQTNPKSKIIEWAQSQGLKIKFELIDDEVKSENIHEFTIQIFIDNKPYGLGIGLSKKKAEQNAAEKTCQLLKLSDT